MYRRTGVLLTYGPRRILPFKCAFTVIFLILLGIVSLKVLAKNTGDDPAGPISLSLMGILATSIIAAIVDALQKPLKNAPDIKSKND